MSKSEVIRSRIDEGRRKIIDKVKRIKNLLSDSEFLEEAIDSYICSLNLTDVELYNEIQNFKQRVNLNKQIQKTKEKTRCYYLIRNCYTTIFKLNQSFVFNSNKPNMVIIQNIIDEYIKLYEDFPEDIKKDLESEIENLKKLKELDYFEEKINIIGMSNIMVKDRDKISFVGKR
jgi:hypothetical protein